MQQQNALQVSEEVAFLRDRLIASEEERDWAMNELRQMRKEADEANKRLQESLTPRKMLENYTELNSMKKLLANSTQELKAKEEDIVNLRAEAEKAKKLEIMLGEKDAVIKKLRDKKSQLKNSKSVSGDKRISELEEELAGRKDAELKVFELLEAVTKELERAKIELAESKLQIVSLQEQLDCSSSVSSKKTRVKDASLKKLEALNAELQTMKEKLSLAQDVEKRAMETAQNLLEDIGKLRNELEAANEAEQNSKKAMDDLAFALKEVATELAEVKLKLDLALKELEHWRKKVDHLKSKAKSTEEKYRSLLDESRKETEKYKNTAERLRLEAEESLLAWNEKETMFVGCIRRAEEEKTLAHQETIRLLENIQSADNLVRESKEDNHKLRDILKHEINEANVAKEAANIAKAENSQLKDGLSEKEDALNFLTREVEILRANEIAGMENIKVLKRLIAEAPQPPTEDKDSRPILMEKEQAKEGRKLGNDFSLNLKELRINTNHSDLDNAEDNTNSSSSSSYNSSKSKDSEASSTTVEEPDESDKDVDESPDESPDDPFKGSIFDAVEDSPGSRSHRRRKSSNLTFTSDGEVNPEELYHLEAAHLDDLENERFSRRRTNRLLRRFGDLLVKKRPSFSEDRHNR